MPAHLGYTALKGRGSEGAVKEEVGEAHGSWVEGGLITHSSAPALPRAAPRGAQPTQSPPQPPKPGSISEEGVGKRSNGSMGLPQPHCRIHALILALEDALLSE